jgi:hypothetical protein
MRIKMINKKDILTLLISIIVPYIIILIIVLPYSNGVHGDVIVNPRSYNVFNSDSDFSFPLPDDEGDFNGNFSIKEGIGWVIVNGKIRGHGSLTINNAKFSYKKQLDDEGGRYAGKLSIDGSKGEMEEGISIYLFCLIGSFIGFLIWCSNIIIKHFINKIKNTTYYYLSILIVIILMFDLYVIFRNSVCIGAFLFILPFIILFYLSLKRKRFKPRIVLIWGLIFLIIFLYFIINIASYSDGRMNPYNVAWWKYYGSFFGLFVTSFLIGIGYIPTKQYENTKDS